MFKQLAGLLWPLSLFAILTTSALAQSVSLSNAYINARFSSTGLSSVKDLSSAAKVNFTNDAWSLDVDGETIQSSSATPQVAQLSSTEVVYTYILPRFRVEIRYLLDPQWHFLTKQLILAASANSTPLIHKVVPLDLLLKNSITSSEQPGTYIPQFGATLAESRHRLPTHDFASFLRFDGRNGLLLTVQNPYLDITRSSQHIVVSYRPEMQWNHTWGKFASDIACIRPYRLSGETLPRQMILEWRPAPPVPPQPGLDRAEISAFADCVRAFMINPAPSPVSVEVGWTLNDYQIDVGTSDGIAAYKRIIDMTSRLGIKNLLYAPSNSRLANISKDTDSWHWEHTLWLNLGQKIRSGEWNPASSAIPSDVSAMIAYARSNGVGLLAYVYPSVPFQQDASWLTPSGESNGVLYASLASRQFQDLLIRDLIAFKRRTGIAGYSFDYTWLNVSGSSSYAQWYGWQRVMHELRRAEPLIVIDGRQSYQEYGPWSWLAGTYPHPTGNDEQPESFTPYPDLHFDRVSADRARFVNYWYRNYQFAPAELIPGYATHQTERSENIYTKDAAGNFVKHVVPMETPYRVRDWDYLGYRYSLLSSIATGGWNNVIDMIPARDPEEFEHFSAADEDWIKGWIDWAITNKNLLLHTRTILDQPAMGHVDGTSAISGNHGFLFLFNPNYKELPADIVLDRLIRLTTGNRFLLREIYPDKGRLVGKPGAGVWSAGDTVHLHLDGTSATVLEISPIDRADTPLIFNAEAHQPAVRRIQGALVLDHVAGEPGTVEKIGALMPANETISKVMVNGHAFSFRQHGNYFEMSVSFAGQRFSQAQEVHLTGLGPEMLSGTFTIPQRIFDQLQARRAAWPIPWSSEDYETTWLVPARLLLYVQFVNPQESMQVSATLNGHSLALKRAYTSVRENAPDFVGFYADLSALKPNTSYHLSLKMPPSTQEHLQGVFFDNVMPQFVEDIIPER